MVYAMIDLMKSRLFSKKNIIRFWLPIVHFVASFFLEKILVIYDLDIKVVAAVEKDGSFSLQAERILGYIIAKIFCGIIIYLFWMLVYYLVDHYAHDKHLQLFTAIFIVGLVLLLFLWPDSFTRSSDNLITYSYAIRLFPEYWHSAYTSLIYLACLMVFPTPFSINIMQWLMFIFTIGYLYKRIFKCEKFGKRAKWTVFLIFLMPECFTLITDAYRTELYALVCMFYVSLILMDIVEGKKRNIFDRIWLLSFSAFISVWRTEGLILGALGFITILVFNTKIQKRKMAIYLAGFAVAFVIISLPQKMGDKKYYGSDYSIINSFATLRNIFNRTDSNLSYEGAEEDLAAIDAVVPIEALRLYGMEGYRMYNVMNGHRDINQSISDFAAGSEYVKAYYRIVLHNPKTYAMTQISLMKVALGLSSEPYIERIVGPFVLSHDYYDYEYDAWDIGESDLYSAPGAQWWINNVLHQAVSSFLTGVHDTVYNFLKKIYVYSAILIAMVIFEFFILIRELIFAVKEKNFRNFGFGFVAFLLLLQAAAIFLVMPAGVLSYFRAFYCCTFVLEILYITKGWKKNARSTDTDNLERA